MDEVTTLVLVRHARTAYNACGRFRGHADVPLDDVGIAQARVLARRISTAWSVSELFTSPLCRALATADAIGEACHLATIVEPRLIDIDYGSWQGLTEEEARTGDAVRYSAWSRAPDRFSIPGGGHVATSAGEARRFVRELAADYPGETVVVVTHDIICQGLTCRLLDIPLRRLRDLQFQPGSITVFSLSGHSCRLHVMDDAAHLATLGANALGGTDVLASSGVA